MPLKDTSMPGSTSPTVCEREGSDAQQPPTRTSRSRRAFLASLGVAGLASLAGCPAPEPETLSPSERTPPTPGPTETGSPTERPTGTGSPTTEPGPEMLPRVILINDSAHRAIEQQVASESQPWFRAFETLIGDAEDALAASPRSVVDNGAPAGYDNPHLYGTDAPYQGDDGDFSAEANREDYQAALRMSQWIRNLAMAYSFAGREEFAEKAVDLLYHWFLNPETRMAPSAANYGPHTESLIGQNSIEHYITIPSMLYGATFVTGHPRWDSKPGNPETQLIDWVEAYLADTEENGHRGGPKGNDIYKWWLVNRAVAAAYLGDRPSLARCFDDWRTTGFKDFESRGTFEFARVRTRGLYYSFSALNALSLTAEVARHYGVDLYRHERNGVQRLYKAFQYHDEYLRNPGDWGWQEIDGLEDFEREFGGVGYELAYSIYGDDRFREAIYAVGRPIYDQRLLGWSTLTHGNLFELDL